MAKAKSGISSCRQFFENIELPPNSFALGGSIFATAPARDGQGHANIHAAVSNDTVGDLQILQSWLLAGPFVLTFGVTTIADPVTALHIADAVVSVSRKFVIVRFVPQATPPGLGASFELGAYFLPR